MLVGKDIYNRIDEIVERAYATFLFTVIGADFLTDEQKNKIEGLGILIGRKPLIELLYLLVKNAPKGGYSKDSHLGMLLDQIALTGIIPALPDIQEHTLEHAKAELHNSIESTKNELKKKVKQAVIAQNNAYKAELVKQQTPTLANKPKDESHFTTLLLAGIGSALLASNKSFVRDFTSTMTTLVNETKVDALLGAIVRELPLKDQRVYKKVIHDGSLCNWCLRFYVNPDGTPRMYAVAELVANGTNNSKPKSQWKPVIGSTHPRCRCELFTKE